MYTVSSFVAGVGGIDLGFEQTENFKTIYANGFDKYPYETSDKNSDIRVEH